jgi:2,3-diketo-5-methylthio-1-phosphopentane phosphatase
MTAGEAPDQRSLLVTDFDGTMTRHDFYALAASSLLPPDMPDYWGRYRAGELTHFEALQAIFALIRADLGTVKEVVERMELDPDLPQALSQLKRSGWDVVVTSAGCDWYIRILLDEAGVTLPVWSNPGRFEQGRGLLMELPRGTPYFSPSLGVDKAAVVREGLATGRRVAFAGDGFPDAEAARLVSAELRFARGDLANVLCEEGLAFRRYERWSEIAVALTDPLSDGQNSHSTVPTAPKET